MPLPSTSIKLRPEIKARVAELAATAGKAPHAWLVEAIEQQVAIAELRESFLDDARRSAEDMDRGGALYAAEDVHAYIAERAAGRTAVRPRAQRRR